MGGICRRRGKRGHSSFPPGVDEPRAGEARLAPRVRSLARRALVGALPGAPGREWIVAAGDYRYIGDCGEAFVVAHCCEN